MGKPSVAPTAARSLFDLELIRPAGAGSYDVVHGYDLAGLLKLGGPKELTNRLAGLVDLLEKRDELNEDEVAFIRGALSDVVNTLWTFDEQEGDQAKLWQVQPKRVATKTAVA